MKHWAWIVFALVVVAIAIAAVFLRPSSGGSSLETPSSNQPPRPQGPLGVDDLMRNVERYRKGPVQVEGVVSQTSPQEKTLTLIDTGEFERCGLGCAKLMLPVRWTGSMPAMKEKVRLEGDIEESGTKLVFVARSVARPGIGGSP